MNFKELLEASESIERQLLKLLSNSDSPEEIAIYLSVQFLLAVKNTDCEDKIKEFGLQAFQVAVDYAKFEPKNEDDLFDFAKYTW